MINVVLRNDNFRHTTIISRGENMMRLFQIIFCLTLLPILIIACSKSAEKTVSNNITSPANAADTPAAVACNVDEVNRSMLAIHPQSNIEQLIKANDKLKRCFALADNTTQLKWIHDSYQMYQRFFDNDNPEGYDEFNAFVHYYKTYKKENLRLKQELSKRDRYLLEQVNQHYIKTIYMGDGIYIYDRDINYVMDLFVPYLPKDQAEFVKKMAKDNDQTLMDDTETQINYHQLIQRATFWGEFMTLYPNSILKDQAQQLFHQYLYVMFVGSENTPITNKTVQAINNPKHFKQLRYLAKNPESPLSPYAQKFLDFLKMPVAERNKHYIVEEKTADGETKDRAVIAQEQLLQALAISKPNDSINCSSDVLCFKEAPKL